MNHLTTNIRFRLAILLTASVFAISGGGLSAVGQEKSEAKPRQTRQSGRDPFSKYVPPRPPVKSTGVVMPPSIQERIAQYKAQKQAAMMARIAAPKPTTAFLLSEMQVVGISRSPRGYAAIVEATPIKLSYVVYPGERFYDGQLVAIEDNRLVFRREVVFNDGRRERTVEMKPLRQSNAAFSLSAANPAPASPAVASEKAVEEKPAAEKP
ncbi:MAG TPA: hypothetical protein VJU86_04740 [Pyrinomonadaceae bacterium]|nr:hypothetical protein [Pyrinomonadaceae bacterium]